jgi:hypothetical protein
MYQGLSFKFLKCAYQANVMKTLDALSRKTDCSAVGISLRSRYEVNGRPQWILDGRGRPHDGIA